MKTWGLEYENSMRKLSPSSLSLEVVLREVCEGYLIEKGCKCSLVSLSKGERVVRVIDLCPLKEDQ